MKRVLELFYVITILELFATFKMRGKNFLSSSYVKNFLRSLCVAKMIVELFTMDTNDFGRAQEKRAQQSWNFRAKNWIVELFHKVKS